MFGEGQSGVGFLVGRVGSVSGFLEESDAWCVNRISRFGRKCRECRVFSSRGELRRIRENGKSVSRCAQPTDNTGLE